MPDNDQLDRTIDSAVGLVFTVFVVVCYLGVGLVLVGLILWHSIT